MGGIGTYRIAQRFASGAAASRACIASSRGGASRKDGWGARRLGLTLRDATRFEGAAPSA
jgi:hypothetical protein